MSNRKTTSESLERILENVITILGKSNERILELHKRVTLLELEKEAQSEFTIKH